MRIAVGLGLPARRVLVCDDERHIARLIQVNLERQGHSVVCAFDGREGIRKLEESLEKGALPFDCAVLDLMMPYKDGFEVLKWIRSNPATERIWVVIMTAQAEQLFEGYSCQPDRYISKPLNPLELLAW